MSDVGKWVLGHNSEDFESAPFNTQAEAVAFAKSRPSDRWTHVAQIVAVPVPATVFMGGDVLDDLDEALTDEGYDLGEESALEVSEALETDLEQHLMAAFNAWMQKNGLQLNMGIPSNIQIVG